MKHLRKSKTIWFNAIMAGLSAAEASFSLLKPYLGESVYGVALFTVIIGNVILRFVTNQAVTLKGADNGPAQ